MEVDDPKIASLRDTAWYLATYAKELRAGEFPPMMDCELAEFFEICAESILRVATDLVHETSDSVARLTPERMFGEDSEDDTDNDDNVEYNPPVQRSEEEEACRALLRRYIQAFGAEGSIHLERLLQHFGIAHFSKLSPEYYPEIMQLAVVDAARHGKILGTPK